MTASPDNNDKPIHSTIKRKLVLTLVALVCVAAGGYFLLQSRAKAQDAGPAEQSNDAQRTTVVTTAAATRLFERTLVVQGNVQTKDFALVSPRVAGTIDAVFVDEGDAVVAGQTQLFQIDAANLTNVLQIKELALTVAQCGHREAAASLEKIDVDLHKAELDYHRFQRLLDKEAVTQDAFEQQQSRYQQLQAARKLGEAQVELATAREAQSRAEVEIARKDLADALIMAPISGTVSQRLQEPGERGNPGQGVLRIDDTSIVEVVAFLPAQHYAAVTPGQTAMRIDVAGIDLGRQVISYKSPTINPKLRTFEIKCVLENPPAGVTSGAMAQIVVVLESREALGVPSQALQERGGHSVVFVVSGNVAQQVAVTTGIETNGWTEIRDSNLQAGAAVVTMGQAMVNDATPVTVQQEAN